MRIDWVLKEKLVSFKWLGRAINLFSFLNFQMYREKQFVKYNYGSAEENYRHYNQVHCSLECLGKYWPGLGFRWKNTEWAINVKNRLKLCSVWKHVIEEVSCSTEWILPVNWIYVFFGFCDLLWAGEIPGK